MVSNVQISVGTGPGLEVVVVGARGYRDLLRDTFASIEENPYTLGPFVVHLVDNGSMDGTVEYIEEHFPWVRLHRMGYNAGFCAANNAVLRHPTKDYVLLLNPDTEVYGGALDHMVGLMEADASVGVSGCRLELRDGTFDHAAKRSFPTPSSAVGHFTKLGGKLGGRFEQYTAPELGEHETGEVDAVNGAFMLIRTTALEEVGLMDEGYWMYGEDLDYCFRFKRAGWRVVYDGTVSILHVKGGGSKTDGHRDLKRNFAFHRTMGRFYRKFYAGSNIAMDFAVYAGISVKFAVSALRSAIARRSIT